MQPPLVDILPFDDIVPSTDKEPVDLSAVDDTSFTLMLPDVVIEVPVEVNFTAGEIVSSSPEA